MSIFGNQFSFHNSDPKIIDVLFFWQVSAGILFSSSPCFFWCLFGLPSVISCRNTYIESGWTQYNDCLKFGTRGGSFLRISNCILLMFSVVKKCQFLETNFLFTIQIQKLLTYCFFAGIRWHPLFFLPLFFLMFIWAAISYQLQEYIHRIWMNSVQWLPEIWQLVGGPFCELQIAFF